MGTATKEEGEGVKSLGQIAQAIIDEKDMEIERLKQQVKELQGNFSHFHVDNEINELCALCGLAVINAVHLRSR